MVEIADNIVHLGLIDLIRRIYRGSEKLGKQLSGLALVLAVPTNSKSSLFSCQSQRAESSA